VKERQAAVEAFNDGNKWKKRGIAVSPMKYPISWNFLMKYNVLLSVNGIDGSIQVSHGGIESGQGLDTKLIQVVAYELGAPVDCVVVQRTSTVTSTNSTPTGSSTTSEMVCKSAQKCCRIMNERMREVRGKFPADAAWKDIAVACEEADLDLNVSCTDVPAKEDGPTYNIWGVTIVEVELDVLTGEHLILQVDLLEDCGISLNPTIDIGQVEGAFVMALGFWLSEEMIFDPHTGRLLTDGTWEYKPPTAKDIPVRWNIELLKSSKNPKGVLNSKATGEPPLCMSVCVVHALRRCVDASLRDRRLKDGFTMLAQPLTPACIKAALKIDAVEDFSI